MNFDVPVLIKFICPVCKSSKELKIANSLLNQSGQLTTISIPKHLVCEHHFQALVDSNCVVKGYKRVDFEFTDDKIKEKEDLLTKLREKDNKIPDEIYFQGNYVEYNPQDTQKKDNNKQYEN